MHSEAAVDSEEAGWLSSLSRRLEEAPVSQRRLPGWRADFQGPQDGEWGLSSSGEMSTTLPFCVHLQEEMEASSSGANRRSRVLNVLVRVLLL